MNANVVMMHTEHLLGCVICGDRKAGLADLAEKVRGLEGACHSRSGLLCEHEGPGDRYDCNVNVARADVLALFGDEPR